MIFRKVVNFAKEIPLNFFLEKKSSPNFPKFQPQNRQVRHHFFKNSLHEGVFENSWKFLQLVQTFTPITNLLCTFSSCSDLSIYLNYNIYKFQQIWRTKNGFTFTSLHFHFITTIAGIGQHSIPISFIKEIPFKIFPSASIFQRNPLKKFFHIIFFTGKSLVKNLKITFNFTWKSF